MTRDAQLVVTFSEPMDRRSTEAAFSIAKVAEAHFAWSQDDTVLTIVPALPLEYALGTDVQVPPLSYSAAVARTAEDAAGNPLARDFEWSFATLRQISQTFPVPFGNVTIMQSDRSAVACGTATSSVSVGHLVSYDYVTRRWDTEALVTVDVGALPRDIVDWESATFVGAQQPGVGYPTVIDHMNVSMPSSASLGAQALDAIGIFSSTEGMGLRSVDVLGALKDDYAHREERASRSQYRLRLDAPSGSSVFGCGNFVLSANYLAP